MKKIFFPVIATLFGVVVFFSCNGKDKTVPVESISLNHATTTRIANYPFRLKATILPENATNKNVTWSSFDDAIVQIRGDEIRLLYWTLNPVRITATAYGGERASCDATAARGCGNQTPAFSSLGTVSFKSDRVWKVGEQEWSDVVMASNCSNREQFNGYEENSTDPYNMDCRSNSGYGDLFSWCAVVGFQDELCPYPWRVPTKDDFANLEKALGGTGEERLDSMFVDSKYVNVWGCTFGGGCYSDGRTNAQGMWAGYWTQSQIAGVANAVSCLSLSEFGSIIVDGFRSKEDGATLRCVKGN